MAKSLPELIADHGDTTVLRWLDERLRLKAEVGRLEAIVDKLPRRREAAMSKQDKLHDPSWLAAAFIAYEADEPHVDLPGCEACDRYPAIQPDVWEAYCVHEHLGDCMGQPCPCVRCAAEMARHKAEWVISQAQKAAAAGEGR